MPPALLANSLPIDRRQDVEIAALNLSSGLARRRMRYLHLSKKALHANIMNKFVGGAIVSSREVSIATILPYVPET
jgi:hypothetical protein